MPCHREEAAARRNVQGWWPDVVDLNLPCARTNIILTPNGPGITIMRPNSPSSILLR